MLSSIETVPPLPGLSPGRSMSTGTRRPAACAPRSSRSAAVSSAWISCARPRSRSAIRSTVIGATKRRSSLAAISSIASPMPLTRPLTASAMLSVPSPEPISTVPTVWAPGSPPTANMRLRTSCRSAGRSNVPGLPIPTTATSLPLVVVPSPRKERDVAQGAAQHAPARVLGDHEPARVDVLVVPRRRRRPCRARARHAAARRPRSARRRRRRHRRASRRPRRPRPESAREASPGVARRARLPSARRLGCALGRAQVLRRSRGPRAGSRPRVRSAGSAAARLAWDRVRIVSISGSTGSMSSPLTQPRLRPRAGAAGRRLGRGKPGCRAASEEAP